MKKWLDDLYAILLKRGFNTLDNELKNYDGDKTMLDNLSYTITSGNIPINADSGISGDCELKITRVGRLVELRIESGFFNSASYGSYDNVFTIPIEYRPEKEKTFVLTSRTGGRPVGITIFSNGKITFQIMASQPSIWELTGCNTIMYFI